MLKKGDFIELEYTGRIKESGKVFDTTDEKIAKSEGIHSKGAAYGPIIICLGEGHIIKGLEKLLEGKQPGKEYVLVLSPEDAFGKKRPGLLKLIPLSTFLKQNIRPVPGLQVSIDGVLGTIKMVGSGRCIVDFNHPLAGKEIEYNVKILRIVEKPEEKISALLRIEFGIADANISVDGSKATIEIRELPKDSEQKIKERIASLVSEIKDVVIVRKKQEQKGKL